MYFVEVAAPTFFHMEKEMPRAGKKSKSCTISDKNAALVPITEFFLHLYIEQSWLLTLSSPFLKFHLAQSLLRGKRGHWGGTWADPICSVDDALGWVLSAVPWLPYFSPGSSTLLRYCRAVWSMYVTFMRWDKFLLSWSDVFHRHGGAFPWLVRFNFLSWICTVREFFPALLWQGGCVHDAGLPLRNLGSFLGWVTDFVRCWQAVPSCALAVNEKIFCSSIRSSRLFLLIMDQPPCYDVNKAFFRMFLCSSLMP